MRARATGDDLFTVQILPPGPPVDSIIRERHFDDAWYVVVTAYSGALLGIQIAVPEEALFVKESSAKPKSVLPGVVEDRTVNGAREKSAPLLTGG
jgi:hypothetical protein